MFVKIFDLLFIGKPGNEKEMYILLELHRYTESSTSYPCDPYGYDIHAYTHTGDNGRKP